MIINIIQNEREIIIKLFLENENKNKKLKKRIENKSCGLDKWLSDKST